MLWSTSDVTYWETFVATDVHKKLDMLLALFLVQIQF